MFAACLGLPVLFQGAPTPTLGNPRHASLALYRDRHAKAAPLLEKAVVKEPKNSKEYREPVRFVAQSYYKYEGKTEEGKKMLERSRELPH